MVKNVPVPPGDRARFAISDDEILQLARWACIIEDHYSAKRGAPTPMDIEWAKDGNTGELFIVQARPETVQSRKRRERARDSTSSKQRGTVLVTGRSVGEKIATGPVRVIKSAQFTRANSRRAKCSSPTRPIPDWEPIMKKAAAIVTNRGGRTCHAAIVSRELGVPAIVGTEHGTEVLQDGQMVTVSCAEGDTGFVYEGRLPFRRAAHEPERPRPSAHQGDDERRQSRGGFRALVHSRTTASAWPARSSSSRNYIKIHPLALLDYDEARRRRREGGDRPAHRRLRRQAAVLRR